MTYLDEIKKAMNWLSEQPDTYVIGQSVKWKGTGLYWTLKDTWPEERRIELPVFEDIQMGMTIGMALEGIVPVSIFPRIDFMILALNQLVNHLDKFPEMSDNQFRPKIIIRTAIGSVKPLFPGPQHNQDHTEAFKKMFSFVDIHKLMKKEDIMKAYQDAYNSDRSTILVEVPDLYNT